MLTPEQQKWIDARSDEKTISIVPYDPKTEELLARVTEKVYSVLGREAVVEHCGASSLGISGQDEIDVSIVAREDQFEDYIAKLETIFGPVRARYPDRARFEVREEGKKIDLKIVDVDHPNYAAGKAFEKYLSSHPTDLERYRILKESLNGATVKEYYRQKIEFINDILTKADV